MKAEALPPVAAAAVTAVKMEVEESAGPSAASAGDSAAKTISELRSMCVAHARLGGGMAGAGARFCGAARCMACSRRTHARSDLIRRGTRSRDDEAN